MITVTRIDVTTVEDGTQPAFWLFNEATYPVIIEALADDWTRYTWQQSGTVTGVRVRAQQQMPTVMPSSGPYPALNIDRVAAAESGSGGRQVLKQISVKGSARSTGSIHVASPLDSVPLGQVLAFTVPQSMVAVGFRPDLRQWYSSGSTATDSSASHGSSFQTFTSSYGGTNSPVFVAPASLFSGGAYTIVARLKPSGTSTMFGMQATLESGGTAVGAAGTVETTFAGLSGAWGMVALGTIYLPPSAVQNASPDARVRFKFKATGLTALDEVYAFPVEGDLTIVDCGTGTVGAAASSHLWIDSPSPSQPQGGYWRSATGERQDALSAWSVTSVPGTHSFAAESMLAFVACTNAEGPSVYFDYFPAWFFNAPQ